jgi:L-amino acid N-acyltransferase YncA
METGGTPVTIREYRDTDYPACRALWSELVEYHDELYANLRQSGEDTAAGLDHFLRDPELRGTWVAEVDGAVVGLIGLLMHGPEHAEVEPIIVTATCRGNGIGGRLMQQVVAAAEKADARFLSIRPGARNRPSISCFTRLGFDHVWTVEMIRKLQPGPDIDWRPGMNVDGTELLI